MTGGVLSPWCYKSAQNSIFFGGERKIYHMIMDDQYFSFDAISKIFFVKDVLRV